jgi:hypothetical protein
VFVFVGGCFVWVTVVDTVLLDVRTSRRARAANLLRYVDPGDPRVHIGYYG